MATNNKLKNRKKQALYSLFVVERGHWVRKTYWEVPLGLAKCLWRDEINKANAAGQRMEVRPV